MKKVIIVGSGYAGMYCAYCAAQKGMQVILLEKAPHLGGISICSAGGVRVAESHQEAFAYLKATCGGRTPDDILDALATGMTRLEEEVHALGNGLPVLIKRRPSPANYPFPGQNTFGFVYVEAFEGFNLKQAYPYVKGNLQGGLLYALLEQKVRASGVDLRVACPVNRLISQQGRVTGVVLESGEEILADAVVLACGGYENNPELQNQFWEGGSAFSAAYRYNTGDGIKMAQELGADLWHMWISHGSYGFASHRQGYPYGVRIKRLPDWSPSEAQEHHLPKMAWILLDKRGKRFMNEYEPYAHDTGIRKLGIFDSHTMDYPHKPAWFVTDAEGLAMYPMGKPLYNDGDVQEWSWSADNLQEVRDGWFHCAQTLTELADYMQVSADVLAESVQAWNQACTHGQDDLGRPSSSMHSLTKAPYYCAKMYPVVSNTHGGPRHNACQQVLNVRGDTIPALYAIGECGSAFGHLYMSGGNIAECFISAKNAVDSIAAEDLNTPF